MRVKRNRKREMGDEKWAENTKETIGVCASACLYVVGWTHFSFLP